MVEKKSSKGKETLNDGEELKVTDQEIVRKDKMKKLAQENIELFPHKVESTHSVHEIAEGFSSLTKEELEKKNKKVAVPGRITSIRKMGRATFFHIIDSRSRLQVYLREDKAGEKNYQLFSIIDIGDIVSVEGVLFKTRTGELSVLADSFVFLAKCLHPLPEKWHGLQDMEIRYRKS